MSATYNEKPVAKWTTNDFLAYITARHSEVYGVEYRPYRSWSAERGLLGGLIGTRQKPRKYEPELVKAFIDECFKIHKGTRDYPGVSFTWLWQFKTAIWQRVLAESVKAKQFESKSQEIPTSEDIIDWL